MGGGNLVVSLMRRDSSVRDSQRYGKKGIGQDVLQIPGKREEEEEVLINVPARLSKRCDEMLIFIRCGVKGLQKKKLICNCVCVFIGPER